MTAPEAYGFPVRGGTHLHRGVTERRAAGARLRIEAATPGPQRAIGSNAQEHIRALAAGDLRERRAGGDRKGSHHRQGGTIRAVARLSSLDGDCASRAGECHRSTGHRRRRGPGNNAVAHGETARRRRVERKGNVGGDFRRNRRERDRLSDGRECDVIAVATKIANDKDIGLRSEGGGDSRPLRQAVESSEDG